MKINKETLQAMRRVIQYNYEDEEKHFNECEPKDRKTHIFKDLKFLRFVLN